jgi:hypothetical protein
MRQNQAHHNGGRPMAVEVSRREQDQGLSAVAAVREHAHEAAAFLKALRTIDGS